MIGMTLMAKNATKVDETLAAIRAGHSRFPPLRAAPERRPRVGALLRQRRLSGRTRTTPRSCAPIEDHRKKNGSALHPVKFLEDRYQALISKYYETGKSPLPCTALSSSCFVDAYWNLYPCSIWSEKVGNLRDNGFDLRALWDDPPGAASCARTSSRSAARTAGRRARPIPTILGNLARAAVSRGRGELQPIPAETPDTSVNDADAQRSRQPAVERNGRGRRRGATVRRPRCRSIVVLARALFAFTAWPGVRRTSTSTSTSTSSSSAPSVCASAWRRPRRRPSSSCTARCRCTC